MSSYWLRQHAYLCVSGNEIVLLDLKTDRYFALNAAETEPLTHWVPGWPASGTPGMDPAAANEAADTLIRLLLERKLLTTDCRQGKNATPLAYALPNISLLENSLSFRPAIGARHVIAFLYAIAAAALQLRGRGLEYTVKSLLRRRAARPSSTTPLDMDSARALLTIFRRLRVFAFSGHNACLFDSLSLIHFLARFGLYPHWMIGVETAPFSAHCWVQQDNVVFNDTVERVRGYTPIMAA